MSATSATVSRWARRYVTAGFMFLVCWQAVALANPPRRVQVALGLYGFVFAVLFGKAYSLLPVYFDRQLAVPRAPAMQFPLSVGGAVLLAAGPFVASSLPTTLGALAWALGTAIFLIAIVATIRDNPTGRETGTGEHNRARRRVDRFANAFVPVVLGYLFLGTYALLGTSGPLPTLLDGFAPQGSHLLAAGTAALLLFTVGFRLLPRFLVAAPPRFLVWLVLPAGAIGPALLAIGIGPGPRWGVLAGAIIEAMALVGFAVAFIVLFVRSDRRRIGFYGVLLGSVGAVIGASLGLWFAFIGIAEGLVLAHLRVLVGGFLGLSIVGVSFQFYPPTVGAWPGSGDRLAGGAIGALAVGLAIEILGLLLDVGPMRFAGGVLGLVGALLVLYVIASAFRARPAR